MKRNQEKFIKEYREMCKENGHRFDFTISEIDHLYKTSPSDADKIFNSLMFGFMAGYKYAQRKAKR